MENRSQQLNIISSHIKHATQSALNYTSASTRTQHLANSLFHDWGVENKANISTLDQLQIAIQEKLTSAQLYEDSLNQIHREIIQGNGQINLESPARQNSLGASATESTASSTKPSPDTPTTTSRWRRHPHVYPNRRSSIDTVE
jgi:hypothetical protein